MTLFAGHGLSKATAFLSTIILARSLSSRDLALYATLVTVLGYAQAITNWGSDAIGIRNVSSGGVGAQIAILNVRKFRLLIGVSLILVAMAVCLPLGIGAGLVLPLGLCIIAMAFRLDWLLLAKARPAQVGMALAAREGVFLLSALAVAATGSSVTWVLWALLLSEVCWAVATIVLSFRLTPDEHPAGGLAPRYLASQGLPIVLVSILSLTNNKIDVPLLAHFRSSVEVASYWAAYNVMFAAMAAAALFTRAALPEMSRQARKSTNDGLASAFHFALISGSAGCFAGLIIGGLAPWIMHTVYGKDLAVGSAPLVILALALPAHFLSAILIGRLVAESKQHRWTLACAAAASLNLGLNLCFIPRFGSTAAAWATVGSEWSMLIGMVVAFRGRAGLPAFLLNAMWVMSCFAAGALALGEFRTHADPLWTGLLVVTATTLLFLPALQWVPGRMRLQLAGAAA